MEPKKIAMREERIRVAEELELHYREIRQIHYLDPNPDGYPGVLLLHGLGVDGSSWAYQIQALVEAGLRPLAPDLPGFGHTPYDGRGWSIERSAGQMNWLLKELDLEEVGVVGLSLGGTIALQMALEYPARMAHLVLMNSFACLRPKRFNELAYLLGRFVVANVRGIEYQAQMVAWRLFPGMDEENLRQELIQRIIQSDPRVYRAAMRGLGLFDVRRRLKSIRTPTTIITAVNDTTVSCEVQQELVCGIHGARQIMIPDSGHAVIVDQPERVNMALVELFSSHKQEDYSGL
jgi:pimeloyl-ACP methyl ester carboxylesterase